MKKILYIFILFCIINSKFAISQCDTVSRVNPTSQTICNNSFATITLAPVTGGNASNSYKWQKSTNGTTWTNATGVITEQNYTTPNLTSTMHYRRIAKNGCDNNDSTISNSAIITVLAPVGISYTTSNQIICYNSIPATLTIIATGGNGSYTYKWEQSTNETYGWENASGGTGTTSANYSPPAISSTIFYRCTVKSGNNCSKSSSNIKITVLEQLRITNQSENQEVCYNTPPSTVSISATGGNNLTYQWQESVNGYSSWTNVTTGSNGTRSDYSPALLSSTKYYRCIVTSENGCGNVVSNNIVITVAEQLAILTQPNAQTICNNTIPNNLTVLAKGGFNLTYQWQESINVSNGWTNCSQGVGYNSNNYIPPALASTKYYKCIITSSNGCGSLTSNNVKTTVLNAFNPGSIRSTGQTVCLNEATTIIGTYENATGGETSSISYRWKKNNELFGGPTSATCIPQSNEPGTFIYSREAKDARCNTNWTPSDSTWTLIVHPEFISGTIASEGQTICLNSNTFAIGSPINAIGGDGNISYIWKKDGEVIPEATTATYTPTSTESGIFVYSREAKDGTCHNWTLSNDSWTLTVLPEFNAGKINSVGEIICINTNTSTIGNTTNASGGDSNIQYRWKNNDNIIENAIEPTYKPSALESGSFIFTREAKDGLCSDWKASEKTWLLIVESTPEIPQIPTGDAELCQFTVKSNYNTNLVSNSLTYNWELTPPEVGNISGSGKDILVSWHPNFTGNAWLKVQTENHCGTSTDFSDSLQIRLIPAPIIYFTNIVNPVCANQKNILYAVNNLNNVTYQWGIENGTITSPTNENAVTVTWNNQNIENTGNLKVFTQNNSSCTYEIILPVSISSNIAPDLENIIAKKDINGKPYMLIYPNPTDDFVYQWYKNDIAINGATAQFFYPENFSQTLEKDVEYKVYVSNLNSSSCGNFTNPYTYSDNSEKSTNISVYPNPASEYFTISFSNLTNKEAKANISLYTSLGTKIFEKEIDTNSDYTHNEQLEKGIYMLQVMIGKEQISTQKIIIK